MRSPRRTAVPPACAANAPARARSLSTLRDVRRPWRLWFDRPTSCGGRLRSHSSTLCVWTVEPASRSHQPRTSYVRRAQPVGWPHAQPKPHSRPPTPDPNRRRPAVSESTRGPLKHATSPTGLLNCLGKLQRGRPLRRKKPWRNWVQRRARRQRRRRPRRSGALPPAHLTGPACTQARRGAFVQAHLR